MQGGGSGAAPPPSPRHHQQKEAKCFLRQPVTGLTCMGCTQVLYKKSCQKYNRAANSPCVCQVSFRVKSCGARKGGGLAVFPTEVIFAA